MDLLHARDVAVDAARAAGALLLEAVGGSVVVEQKDARDCATAADKRVATLLIERLRAAYPEWGVSIEDSEDLPGSPRWVIDPLDGTKYFADNVPLFTVSIALEVDGAFVVGVVFDPSTDRLYHAIAGEGAFCDDRRLSVSLRSLGAAVVAVDLSGMHRLREDAAFHQRLRRLLASVYRVRALGCGSLELCYLAEGHFDAYVDLTGQTKEVDVAAGMLIAREAGAVVSGRPGAEPLVCGSAQSVALLRALWP